MLSSVPIIALIGYPVGGIAIGGFLMLYLVAGWMTRRARKGGSARDDAPALGCATLIAGPAIGTGLAFIRCRFGGVNPLDVGFTYMVFVALGSFVGFMGACAFAVASLAARARHKKNVPLDKL